MYRYTLINVYLLLKEANKQLVNLSQAFKLKDPEVKKKPIITWHKPKGKKSPMRNSAQSWPNLTQSTLSLSLTLVLF